MPIISLIRHSKHVVVLITKSINIIVSMLRDISHSSLCMYMVTAYRIMNDILTVVIFMATNLKGVHAVQT